MTGLWSSRIFPMHPFPYILLTYHQWQVFLTFHCGMDYVNHVEFLFFLFPLLFSSFCLSPPPHPPFFSYSLVFFFSFFFVEGDQKLILQLFFSSADLEDIHKQREKKTERKHPGYHLYHFSLPQSITRKEKVVGKVPHKCKN